MAPWLIALCKFIYVYVAGDLMYHGRYALGVAYLGYAFANIGLYFAAKT